MAFTQNRLKRTPPRGSSATHLRLATGTRGLLEAWRLLVVTLAVILVACDGKSNRGLQEVKVGVLYSQTGPMADSEKPLIDATLMAINEINEQGLIPNVYVEAIIENGASDPETFAKKAESLIRDEGVVAIFGGCTSASRKAMKPIIEGYDSILFYSEHYEGMETSSNIVYLGPIPNQQIIPAVDWAQTKLQKKRFFLVSTDALFPRVANEVIKDQVKALGTSVVGETYLPLESDNVATTIEAIKQAKPDMILNTLMGSSNKAFFKALREANILSKDLPTLSFNIDENEVQVIGKRYLAGDYLSWNYYQTIDTPENREWVRNFKNQFGVDRVLSAPMEAAYIGVYLWAKTVNKGTHLDHYGVPINGFEPSEIKKHISGQNFKAPDGLVFIHPENWHLYKVTRIGQIGMDGQIRVVWYSDVPVRPEPYPIFRSKNDWEALVNSLSQQKDNP